MSGPKDRKNKGRAGVDNPASDTLSSQVDKDMLDNLFKSLNNLRSTLGLEPEVPEGAGQDIRGVLGKLITTVQSINDKLSKTMRVQEEQERRMRNQEDETDEIRQRSLKGNIIVSSIPNKAKGKVSLLKTDDQLKAEGMTMHAHIIDLVHDKFGVVLPESDIQACHRLPKGSVVLRIWNRKEGSAWESLVSKIKSPENSEFNVYFNFHLTSKRSNLLYECRMLKKSGKIDRFYSDENGSIKMKVKASSKDKIKITYTSNSAKDMPVTFNVDELLKLVAENS